MSRRLFVVALALAALVALYRGNNFVRGYILDFTNSLKSIYIDIENRLADAIEEYFDQARQIRQLRQQNRELMRYKIAYKDLHDTLERFRQECNVTFTIDSMQLAYVKVLSYVNFGDFTSMWLDVDLEPKKIYGILKGESVAGIAVREGEKSLALLNGNKKCSYGVLIGGDVSGIAVGSGDNRYVDVKYIPTYAHIKHGDLVITSGLDGIFAYGLSVGVVTQVWQEGSYKVAKVRTFADLSHPRFFWLMKL